ncbi:uncharacterized protein LOC144450753 [Glandiceps talaboti]
MSMKPAHKEGYLWRYGGHPYKTWKYWYASLSYDLRKGIIKLRWSGTPDDAKKRSFHLNMSTLREGEHCQKEMSKIFRQFDPLACNGHIFGVSSKDGKRHYVMADTGKELQSWLDALNDIQQIIQQAKQVKEQQHKHRTWGLRIAPKQSCKEYNTTVDIANEEKCDNQATKQQNTMIYGYFDGHKIHARTESTGYDS